MNETHRIIRHRFKRMARPLAIELIKSFQLLRDEEAFIIEHDVNNVSIIELSQKYNLSIETIKRRRGEAYNKISQLIDL